MTKKIIKSNSKIFIIIFLLFVSYIVSIVIRNTFSSELDNDIEVEPNTVLTYYLNINYDGIDINGVKSSNTKTIDLSSDTMLIQDTIPKGLTFLEFVPTSDGSIGAVKRSDNSTPCSGRVIDDTNESQSTSGVWNSSHTEYTYHGLHYNSNTGVVTFKVKDLQAGCKLTVGIKTKTPPTVDDPDTEEIEKRRDFYNFATILEKSTLNNSNIVHTYMGNEFEDMYDVKYSYVGIEDSISIPPIKKSAPGSVVKIDTPPTIEGYTFKEWSSSDVTINDNSFIMPEKNVEISGTYVKNAQKKVTYVLQGEVPKGYEVPDVKNYLVNQTVKVDSMKSGDVYNGYTFKGWSSSNVTISENNDFKMPTSDVVLQGEFEPIKHKVIYQFTGSTMPANANDYLPKVKEYSENEIVKLETVPELTNYEFSGWLHDDDFKMPDSDVTIYGEWKKKSTKYLLHMSQTFVGPSIASMDDEIIIRFTISNDNNFDISNVMIKREANPDIFSFKIGKGYSEISDKIFMIDSIPAHKSATIEFHWFINDDSVSMINSKFTILGATAPDGFELDELDSIESDFTFDFPSELKLCNKVSGYDTGNTFIYKITSTDNKFETSFGLKNNECKTISLNPNEYTIKEIVPQEYTIKNVEGARDGVSLRYFGNGSTKVTYTNEYNKKGFIHSFGRVINKILGGA